MTTDYTNTPVANTTTVANTVANTAAPWSPPLGWVEDTRPAPLHPLDPLADCGGCGAHPDTCTCPREVEVPLIFEYGGGDVGRPGTTKKELEWLRAQAPSALVGLITPLEYDCAGWGIGDRPPLLASVAKALHYFTGERPWEIFRDPLGV